MFKDKKILSLYSPKHAYDSNRLIYVRMPNRNISRWILSDFVSNKSLLKTEITALKNDDHLIPSLSR